MNPVTQNSNQISSICSTEKPPSPNFTYFSTLTSSHSNEIPSLDSSNFLPLDSALHPYPGEVSRSRHLSVHCPLVGKGAVKTHQASPTAFMGFLPLFLGMYSSSGERGSGSSLHSGELWLCSALVLFWEALLAVAPERIPVNEKYGRSVWEMRKGKSG